MLSPGYINKRWKCGSNDFRSSCYNIAFLDMLQTCCFKLYGLKNFFLNRFASAVSKHLHFWKKNRRLVLNLHRGTILLDDNNMSELNVGKLIQYRAKISNRNVPTMNLMHLMNVGPCTLNGDLWVTGMKIFLRKFIVSLTRFTNSIKISSKL
jgi:hypothetical protein